MSGDTFEGIRIALDEALALVRERDQQLVALRKRCHDLTTARDAWMETAHRALKGERLRDQTDPGPRLVAEERAAFPARALRGGGGVFHG